MAGPVSELRPEPEHKLLLSDRYEMAAKPPCLLAVFSAGTASDGFYSQTDLAEFVSFLSRKVNKNVGIWQDLV